MEKALVVLLLLCSLSGADLQDNEISEKREARFECEKVPEQPQPCLSDVHAVLRELTEKLAVHQTKMETLNQLQVKMEQQQTLNQEQAAKLAKYEVKMEQLQTLNQEQAAKLSELQTKTSEVDPLKEQLREQAAKLSELQTKTSEVDPLKEQLRGQAAELNILKSRTNVTENHVDSLRRDRAVGQVAFSASLLASGGGDTGPFNTHTTLVFRNVLTNIGNAYSPNTGFFTAPVRGAYHFEIYIHGNGHSSYASAAWLVKNGQNTFMAWEHQTNGAVKSSNGATLLLEAGDVVFVRQPSNTRIFDNENHHTMFSGHLLFLM